METEAELGVYCQQSQAMPGMAAATRSQERGSDGVLPTASRRKQTCRHLDFAPLVSRTMGQGVSVVLSHKVMVIYYCSPRKPVQHGMGRRHSRPRRNRWGFAHGRHSLRQVIRYLEELANPGKAGCPGQRGPGCQSAKNIKIRKYSTT